MATNLEAQIQSLIDREAIRDVLMRYCYGADRCDESMLDTVYWPEAIDDHGVFSGKASEYIPFLLKMASQMDQMQHLVGNILIRNEATSAKSESYFMGYHRQNDEKGKPFDMIAAGRYLDTFEKRGDEWRVIRRQVVFDWYRNLEGSADWSRGFNGLGIEMGGRVPKDPSVAHFAQNPLTRSPI